MYLNRLRVLAAASLALAMPVIALSQINSEPPRSTADVLAILDEYKPDAQRIKRFREIVSRQEPQSKDAIDQRNFYLERGRAAGALGIVAQQIDDLGKAYALTPRTDPNRVNYGFEMRLAEWQAGDYAGALKGMEQAVSDASNDGGRLGAWTALAAVRAQLGDLAGSRDALTRSESLMRSVKNSPGSRVFGTLWEALLARARAQVKRYEGKYAEAEIDERTAIRLWEEVIKTVAMQRQYANVTVESRTQFMLVLEVNHLVPILLEQGKLAEAEVVARNALKRSLETFGRYAPETGTVLVRLAAAIFEQGRFDEARILAKAAEDIFTTIGAAPYSSFVAEARGLIGEALTEGENYTEAVKVFEAMLDGLKQNPSGTEGLVLASPAWIQALVRFGRTPDAVATARKYYGDLSKRFGDQLYATHEAHGFYALALAANGERDAAVREFRIAIPPLVAAAGERQGGEGLGIARTRRLTRILEAYIVLLSSLALDGKTIENMDLADEAFRIADVARGSSVQRALAAASARATIRDPELAKLAREEQDAGQRIGSLSGILVDLLTRPAEKRPETVIDSMRRDVETLRKRRAGLRQEIQERFPDYANLIDPKPVTLEAARKVLVPGEVLVVLYGTDDRTIVWAVPQQGAVRFHVVQLGRAQRDELVRRLREALDVGDVSLERFPQFDVARAHELYTALLKPVEPTWSGAKSLLIVPHGSLATLPFSLLVTQPGTLSTGTVLFEGYKSIAWLIRRTPITQLPSVNTIVSLRAVTRAKAPTKAFVGFGDPIFGRQQLAQAGTNVGTRSMRLRNLALTATEKKANSIRIAQLAPLPDTAEELEEIANAVGAAPQQNVFLRLKASEQVVKSTDLSDRRIVAFATHGLVPGDIDGLMQPALALSNPELTGEKDADGLLAMDEILALKLNADWVVLSACNTASAGGAGEEAVSGLGRAFFYAGARSLLVSNWPIETVSARLLTTDIFRRQAVDPKVGRAEALRQSMLALIDGPGAVDPKTQASLYSYAHPMFWAPFSVVGDGN